MPDSELTEVELRAEVAQRLKSFPINIRHIRDNVEKLLSQVGRYGFFDEYTDHSFDHVIGMLKMADWLIPAQTKTQLTPSDWILITLSIYFHDLGLLISKDEYERRSTNPDFQKFKTEPVIASDKYEDYIARINQLPSEESEKIIYQEFVRYTHGNRIKAWIEGTQLDDNEASKKIRLIIQGLLGKLDTTIKRDIALVCDSHTKYDIDNTSKYKISQPYGSTADETANLQYVAAILRTVDLLQITEARAPTILYQLINPTDPVSQIEWQKQNAVRSVRQKPGIDRDGQASEAAQSDTIEVHARFLQSDGFFGLTSYLAYAQKEIQACHLAISQSESKLITAPKYPWRYIDSSNVEAEGFLTESFGFSLDQHKILDLLTGHTLYNDTTVVLRELTQNSLDAIRLQSEIDKSNDNDLGLVEIKWESANRALQISDNGTGMTQSVIQNHLLKVGSSRYQDQKFKEEHPDFSSISRFGIGVLSAFMISDDVQITTCSVEEDKARRIDLRSVHGQYLIKLLDKIHDRSEIGVYPHGTSIRLLLRPTAEIGDIVGVAKMWLMFPRCRVTVQVDDADPIAIGYESPKEAIEEYVKTFLKPRGLFRREIEVRELSKGGVTLAFAVEKDEIFTDWSFVSAGVDERRRTVEDEKPPTGMCIEGVGVEFNTPGFRTRTILAVSNAVGASAPKTNVARSALEDTDEQRDMLRAIYGMYAEHVSSEIRRLAASHNYSLTRAVGNAPYIANPLFQESGSVTRLLFMKEAMSRIPAILIERPDGRHSISYTDLSKLDEFWTVEAPLYRSIEDFVSEAPTDIGSGDLLRTLGKGSTGYLGTNTVCNFYTWPYLEELIVADFEIAKVIVDEGSRRLDLCWRRRGITSRWISLALVQAEMLQIDRKFAQMIDDANDRPRSRRRVGANGLNIAVNDVEFEGLSNAGGVISNRERYFRPEEPLSKFLKSLSSARDPDSVKLLYSYLILIETIDRTGIRFEEISSDYIKRSLDSVGLGFIESILGDAHEIIQAVRGSRSRLFDPFAWDRRDPDEIYF